MAIDASNAGSVGVAVSSFLKKFQFLLEKVTPFEVTFIILINIKHDMIWDTKLLTS